MRCWLPLLLVPGCAVSDPAAGPPLQTTRTDSAGVEIVMTTGLASLPQWTVDSVPALSIGSVDGGGPEALSNVTGVLGLRDGSILIADLPPVSVRLFDPAGRFVREVVREGAGPAELSGVGSPSLLRGDTVAIFDGSRGRVILMDSALQHLATIQMQLFRMPEGSVGVPLTVTSANETVGNLSRVPGPSEPNVRRRNAMVLGRIPFDGSTFDTIATGRGQEVVPIVGIFSSGIPMAGSSTFLAVPEALFLGESDEAAVGMWALDGRLIRSIRWETSPDSVTADDRRQIFRRDSANWFRSREISAARRVSHILEGLRNRPVAAEAPRFTRILRADDGGLWIERRPRSWLPRVDYLIADSTGALVARIDLPASFRPLQVGPSWVLGVWRDADDVPFVQRRTLHR